MTRREERELAEWREGTVYLGLQAGLTEIGYEIIELRNDRTHNTLARVVGEVVRHVDGLTCTCLGCGRDYYEEDGLPLEWSGRYLAGGCWCSEACREAWSVAAGEVCVGCGGKPTHIGPDGGICLTCLRHDVRDDVRRLATLDGSDAVQEFAASTGLFTTANPPRPLSAYDGGAAAFCEAS